MTLRFAVALVILSLAAVAFYSLPTSREASYSNVAINIQTQENLPYSFTVSVFNTTGYLLASYQSQFPAAAFQLPDGQYIFTATAYYDSYQSPRATDIYPVPYFYMPATEYGYVNEQISGSATLTLVTQNVTSIPKTTVSVQVSYANGTGAEGASVSASILGSWYYWNYGDSLQLWTTTGADGSATLIAPQAPLQINAWTWVYVNLPSNVTTIEVTVAGEQINVTVYWQPTYVGLAGSAIVIPPDNSATITLHVQQPYYWVYPLGVTAQPAQGGMATAASGPGSVPANVYYSQQGNPMLTNFGQAVPEFPPSAILAIPFVAALLATIFLKKRKKI